MMSARAWSFFTPAKTIFVLGVAVFGSLRKASRFSKVHFSRRPGLHAFGIGKPFMGSNCALHHIKKIRAGLVGPALGKVMAGRTGLGASGTLCGISRCQQCAD